MKKAPAYEVEKVQIKNTEVSDWEERKDNIHRSYNSDLSDDQVLHSDNSINDFEVRKKSLVLIPKNQTNFKNCQGNNQSNNDKVDDDWVVNFTQSDIDSSPKSRVSQENNDPFKSLDSDVFKQHSSFGDSPMDPIELAELENEKIDMTRESLPECEMAFTPRRIFFMNNSQENTE